MSRVVEAADEEEGPKKPNLSGLFALLGANMSAAGPPAPVLGASKVHVDGGLGTYAGSIPPPGCRNGRMRMV